MPDVQNTAGRLRWTICGLLFAATTINYIDRQVIGLLKPTLQDEFHWTESDYATVVMAFNTAYAIGLLLSGRLIDRFGTRLGYTISVAFWSLAAMLHGGVASTLGFLGVRAMLGLGEGGNFPNAIKATAEWFPRKERALATGIFNSGANIGAMLAPVLVPWILGLYGWRQAFIWTGALGIFWLVAWWIWYEVPSRHHRLSSGERNYIQQDDEIAEPASPYPVMQLLRFKQTWAFVLGKFLTDPIWWFFLFWLPSYFSDTYAIDLRKPNWQLVAVYMATSLGSIGGGYLSSYLISKGWGVFRARKTSMLVFALCVLPVITAPWVGNIWTAVALISLAAASHQAWSATIFTTASDIFPKSSISTVVGIGGMAGSVGGILFPLLVGWLLDYYKSAGHIGTGYTILFLISGSAYGVAWMVMHWLTPKSLALPA
ncbi:MAG: MFS transporter [Cyclobacteriaceae bacterium]|nr:MFS transporter [Cyclobacteriaceae bacterium]